MFRHNQNWLVACCGQPGSGKSYSLLKLMEDIYLAQYRKVPTKNIVFTVKGLLERLNSGELKRGDVVLFDELGVAANARKWMSDTNMALNYLVQTFRYLNLTVLFSCPSFDYIDIAVRKMFHGLIETQHIDYEKKQCVTKFKRIEFNPTLGKVYMKYPYDIEGNKLKGIRFGLADKDLRREYELMQQAYKSQLQEELNKNISAKNKPAEAKEVKQEEDDLLKIEEIRTKLKEKKLKATIDNIFVIGELPSKDKARTLRSRMICARVPSASS